MIDIRTGDALDVLRTMPADSVQCCVTSPPYFALRDYGVAGQIGMEPTLAEFLAKLVAVFAEVRRVLRPDGVCWITMGDSYAGSWGAQGSQGATGCLAGRSATVERHIAASGGATGSGGKRTGVPRKNLLGVPWRLALALQDDGWILRSDCIWHKPNPMPESITDRPTKAHEYVFLFSKSPRYFYDADSVRQPYAESTKTQSGSLYDGLGTKEYQANGVQNPSDVKRRVVESLARNGGANLRTVWTIATEPLAEAHFAAFPQALARNCVLSGSRPGDMVLDPFCGAGTTGLVALGLGRRFTGIELNPKYVKIAKRRIQREVGIFAAAIANPKETTA